MLCVLKVDGMSVVMNVMLSLMSVRPNLLPCATYRFALLCEIMYFGCFGFWGELCFLNCDDVCMCVVNEQFELLKFVFDAVYVDLQYDEIYLTFTVCYVSLCCVCGHVVVFGLSVRLSWYPICMRWLL